MPLFFPRWFPFTELFWPLPRLIYKLENSTDQIYGEFSIDISWTWWTDCTKCIFTFRGPWNSSAFVERLDKISHVDPEQCLMRASFTHVHVWCVPNLGMRWRAVTVVDASTVRCRSFQSCRLICAFNASTRRLLPFNPQKKIYSRNTRRLHGQFRLARERSNSPQKREKIIRYRNTRIYPATLAWMYVQHLFLQL